MRLLDADDSICADVVAMTTDDMLAPTLLTMNEATVEMVRIRRGVEVGCPGCGVEAHTLEYAVASVLRSGKSAFLEECAHPWTDLELIKAVVPCEPGLYLALPRCYIPKMVQLHRDMAYTSNAYTTYEKSRPGFRHHYVLKTNTTHNTPVKFMVYFCASFLRSIRQRARNINTASPTDGTTVSRDATPIILFWCDVPTFVWSRCTHICMVMMYPHFYGHDVPTFLWS